FSVYALWDLYADLFSAGCLPGTGSRMRTLWKGLRVAGVSVFASVFCLALTSLVFAISSMRQTWLEVVLLDLSLICVVLLFRASKVAENALARSFRVTDCKAFEEPRRAYGSEGAWAITLFIAYVAFMLSALKV